MDLRGRIKNRDTDRSCWDDTTIDDRSVFKDDVWCWDEFMEYVKLKEK